MDEKTNEELRAGALVYRAEMEDGSVMPVYVVDMSAPESPFFRAWGGGWLGYVAADTPRAAAAKVVTHARGLPVVSILAPGEPTRALMAAEKERVANLLTDRLEDETEPLQWSSVSWDRARPDVLTLSVTEKRGTERSVVIPLEKVPSITTAAKVARAR